MPISLLVVCVWLLGNVRLPEFRGVCRTEFAASCAIPSPLLPLWKACFSISSPMFHFWNVEGCFGTDLVWAWLRYRDWTIGDLRNLYLPLVGTRYTFFAPLLFLAFLEQASILTVRNRARQWRKWGSESSTQFASWLEPFPSWKSRAVRPWSWYSQRQYCCLHRNLETSRNPRCFRQTLWKSQSLSWLPRREADPSRDTYSKKWSPVFSQRPVVFFFKKKLFILKVLSIALGAHRSGFAHYQQVI